MEDEECLPENSGLRVYLKNLGYSDIEVAKKVVQNPSHYKFEGSKLKNERTEVELIDEEVIEQISIILSTQMLFEEDILCIENLLSHFEVVKNSVLKHMFKDLYGVAIIFVGLCLYWVIGYYAFILVSSFYAYIAAFYLRRRYYYRIRLKKLSSIIQGNFLLMKRAVKLIEDNKIFESKFTDIDNSNKFLEGFDYYKNFKNDFLLSINEIINIFIKSTQVLMLKVPLYDYVENPECYLCNNLKKNDEPVNLSTLYEIYLLLQSEFLKRLIFSLIPSLKLSTNDNFDEINKILSEICLGLLKVKKTTNKKFKFLFLNGIHSPTGKVEFKLPKKKGFSDNPYMEEIYVYIHEVSLIFQNLLLKCRLLEENIECEKTFENMENELTEVLNKLKSCQRNVSDCLILLSKSNSKKNKCNQVTTQEEIKEIDSSNEKLNKVEVGFSDLDPKVDDEIFEMYLANEEGERNFLDNYDWDLNERLEKKLKKEYTTNVIKELKVKLVEKAENWKKREKEVFKRKGLVEETPDLEQCDKSTDEENETESVNNKNITAKVSDNLKNDFQQFDEHKNENEGICCKSLVFENSKNDFTHDCTSGNTNAKDKIVVLDQEDRNFTNTQSPVGAFQTSLFNDLNEARLKIFGSSIAVEEELLCDSDESDSS